MKELSELFSAALQLSPSWYISNIELLTESDGTSLYVDIDFYRGSEFEASDGKSYTAYDTRHRVWRHLNFFQYKCYLRCHVPRVKTESGRVETIGVPWSRAKSGFTLMFEQFVLMLVHNEMPVHKVGAQVGENPHRIWTIIRHYVDKEYEALDHSQLKQMGIDETSIKRGHNYITVAVDMESRKVVHVTPGRDKESVRRVREYLQTKGCPSEQVEELSMDMSPAYIGAGLEEFEHAQITFDKFHIKKKLNEAMDKVRKAERREHDILKGHKYTFLKSNAKLSEKRKKQRDELITLLPKLGEAYRLKVLFDDLWDMKDIASAEAFLTHWCDEVKSKKIHHFESFINMLHSHWYGVIQYFKSGLNNGILEGINSKIQLAKKRARGYRNISNYIRMIYLISSGININPLKST